MFCPTCGTNVQQGQKFCTECGASLAGLAAPAVDGLPTMAAPAVTPLPPPNLAPPVVVPPVVFAAADAPTPPHGLPAGEQYTPTAALSVVEQTSPTGYDPSWDTGQQWAAQGGDTGESPAVSDTQPFRITPLVAVSALAAVLAVATAFVDVASYKVTGGLTEALTYKVNDFASNYTVGAIIAAIVLVGGAALGATGRRVGAGLAGGAGLALAGMMGMMLGQVTQLFDSLEVSLLSGGGSFTLTTTQEIGFWLAVVAAVLGGGAFVLSLLSAGPDGHRPVNPAIGVVGALGTLAVVIGPLLPMNGGKFGDNFGNDLIPPATTYLRLLVLVLIGVGGLVGFLRNRRWGLGLALGAISIGVWQWVTSIGESGDIPLGIAGGNVGATDFKPHVVTTIGVVVMVLAGLAGLVIAAQQRNAR